MLTRQPLHLRPGQVDLSVLPGNGLLLPQLVRKQVPTLIQRGCHCQGAVHWQEKANSCCLDSSASQG